MSDKHKKGAKERSVAIIGAGAAGAFHRPLFFRLVA